jgi:regulatory protein
VEAIEAALRAVARKERTVAELRGWLEAHGFEAGDIEAAVERLRVLGQLDDDRFARRYAEDKRDLNGWGPERIAEALAARGVDPEAITAALTAAPDGEVEAERAADLIRSRGAPPRDERARARAFAYLRRRGYPAEVAYDAVRRAEGGLEAA